MTDPDHPAELFQLDRNTCLTLLTTQCVGRLVLPGDEPTIVVVNYAVDDDLITFRTEAGSRAARAEPRPVLFEVDMVDTRTHSGWSVIVHGQLTPRRPDAPPVELDTWAPGDRDQWMSVTVDAIAGRLLRGPVTDRGHAVGGYV